MLRRLRAIVCLLALGSCAAWGQYDVNFSHYWDMETWFNPGAVGKQSKINVVGVYNMTMAGFEHNPNTFFVAGDMPFYALNSYHGVGLNLMNDKIGLFTHQRIAAQYAYKHKLFGGNISAGVQVGFINESFNGSGLDLDVTNDVAFATSAATGNTIDMAFGLYYTHGSWYAGLSGQHLTAPLVELGETNELQIDRSFYLTGGYNIKLKNPFLSIPTSVLVQTDLVGYRADITGRLNYVNDKKDMYLGLGYSPTNSVTFFVGGSISGIRLGYSYEVYTSNIGILHGSHELFVGYQQDINLYKKGKNKHKSVRIL